MFLTRISVSQPVFTTMMMVALMVFGLFSYNRLPVEQYPAIDLPIVAALVNYPGASPEAVETEIVRPIEDAVNNISGIDNVQSTAMSGSAMVLIQFKMSVNSNDAAQQVRDKIASIEATLPRAAEKAQVLRYDPADLPIMSLAVRSESLSARDLTQLAEDMIVRRLSNIEGVGRANIIGGAKRQLDIDIDPDRLIAHNVGVGEVIAALRQHNQDLPAGSIRDASLMQSIQVEGRIKDADGFLDIVVARAGGQAVLLGDVATVRDSQQQERNYAFINGEKGLAIDIIKTQGANTVGVAREVRAEIDRLLAGELPADVGITVVSDNAVPVQQSLDGVVSMIIEGAILATVIVFLFLNSWRSTVITALTLPISILGTLAVLLMFGFTLNMMTLMALSLSVGILIDDAIVVRENIMRHLHMGKGHRQAALDGTNEIGLAVLATTLSIIAVFLPVAFMDGIIGRFFLQFGVTVSVAVMLSLFIAFTLDPMMSSVWHDPAAHTDAKRGPVGRAVQAFDRWFEGVVSIYRSILSWCLRFCKTTLGLAFATLAGAVVLLGSVGTEFVPSADTGQFTVQVTTPVGSSLETTATKVLQIEDTLRRLSEVEATYSTVGGTENRSLNTANVLVKLVDYTQRHRTPTEMAEEARELLKSIPGVETSISAAEALTEGKPIQVFIFGDNTDVLRDLGNRLVAELGKSGNLVDITSSLRETQPVIGLRINDQVASDLRIDMQQIGDTLQPLLNGEKVSNWNRGDGKIYDVVVRLPAEMRDDPSRLGDLPLAQTAAAEGSTLIHLDQVAKFSQSEAPGTILRRDQSRQVLVSANVGPAGMDAAQASVQEVISGFDLPGGYRFGQGGETEEMEKAGAAALTAIMLAVVLIYLVLASQFASFLQPIAIMISLPLCLSGVVIGLIVGGSTLNMMSMIGFIMLLGLVVKNAILLVDNANQRVREGAELRDALIEAGATRFRPIVMTTLAMIFGMLPMALALHHGSEQNAPMAHAVIGGLVSSTLLTLVVVPVILIYVDRFATFARRFMPRAPDDVHAASPEAGTPNH